MSRYLDLAESSYRSGALGDAERYCRQAIDASTDDVQSKVLLGIVLCRTGRLAEAVDELESVVGHDQRSIAGWTWLTTAYRRLGRIDDSVRAAERLVDIDPSRADAYGKLGQALMISERLEDARTALETARRLDPKAAVTHNNLGLLYLQLGLDGEAETSLRAAMAADPANTASRLSLLRLLIASFRYAEAAELARQGLVRHPDDAELHYVLAQALGAGPMADEGNEASEEAIKHLRRSIELDGNNATVWATLGWAEQTIGAFEEARSLFEKSLSIEPHQGGAYLGLTRGKKISPDDRDVIDRMETAVASGAVTGKDLTYLHYALAKAYDDLDEVARAMSNFDEANRLSYELHRSQQPFDRDVYAAKWNLARELFTADVLREPKPLGIQGPTPILIVGVMRSGTTLLEQILSSHPDVAACGEILFWRDEGAAAYETKRAIPGPGRLAMLGEAYMAPIRSAVRKGANFATDKLPHNYEQLGMFHLTFPNAPIVYIRRHAVDTCLSIYTTPYSIPPDFVYDKGDIAFVYEQHLELMEFWRSVLPEGRVFELRYEELIDDREAVIRRLLDYCGLDWDARVLHHEANERKVRTPSNWQVRQPVYRSSLERWRRYEPWLGEFKRLLPLG